MNSCHGLGAFGIKGSHLAPEYGRHGYAGTKHSRKADIDSEAGAAIDFLCGINPANRPVLTVTFTPPSADLTIAKSHAGAFRQGDAADTYTIAVSNAGAGPTAGAVTVTDTLPSGLAPTPADSGTVNGWSVTTSGPTVTATRADALAAGSSYPALTLTVSVAANAPASVTNTATVAGGGEVNTANDSASDVTAITQLADLAIAKSHTGTFRPGDPADAYTITVSNVGAAPTDGSPVTITDVLPAGLAPTAADNGTVNGWAFTTSGQTERLRSNGLIEIRFRMGKTPVPAGRGSDTALGVCRAHRRGLIAQPQQQLLVERQRRRRMARLLASHGRSVEGPASEPARGRRDRWLRSNRPWRRRCSARRRCRGSAADRSCALAPAHRSSLARHGRETR